MDGTMMKLQFLTVILGALIGQGIYVAFLQRDDWAEFFATMPFRERLEWFLPHQGYFIFAITGAVIGLIFSGPIIKALRQIDDDA
jgi:hypothetical protein